MDHFVHKAVTALTLSLPQTSACNKGTDGDTRRLAIDSLDSCSTEQKTNRQADESRHVLVLLYAIQGLKSSGEPRVTSLRKKTSKICSAMRDEKEVTHTECRFQDARIHPDFKAHSNDDMR